MIEIRWHGRGGQGAVTASKILAESAVGAGKYMYVVSQEWTHKV